MLRTAIAAAALVSIAVVAAELRRSDDALLDRVTDRPAPLLAVAGDREDRRLVRLDPLSLRPLPGSVHLDEPARVGVWHPHRRLAAVVTGGALRLLDLQHMRTLATVRVGARGGLASSSWPRRDRIWLVFAARAYRARATTTVVLVDAVRWRVIARRRLAARLVRLTHTPNGPALLLAPPSGIGPAEIATVDPQGELARLRLDVAAGAQSTDEIEHVRRPALAVDARQQRAYVLSVYSEVIEVDLQSLRARRHRLSAPLSLLDRLRELFDPPAEARSPLIGRERSATWLASGLIAVAGHDSDVLRRATGALEQGSRPAGLQLVDTRRWQVRTLDQHAATVHVAAGLMLVAGMGRKGLAAYRPDGHRAFHLLENERVEIITSAGSLAYVRTESARGIHVVDLRRGTVIATATKGSARLLPAASDIEPDLGRSAAA
jgi:hypothetical protein